MSSKSKSGNTTHGKKSRATNKSQLELQPGIRAPKEEAAEPSETYTPSPDDPTAEVPLSREEIGAKVCAKRDIIQVACDLLAGHGDPKQAPNRLRAFQVVVDSLFGKPGADSDDPPPPADWNGIPAPDRETP
ncbi:MAG: hypothetical protein WAM91_13240 [Candidatus Acidiferrales bacterium]